MESDSVSFLFRTVAITYLALLNYVRYKRQDYLYSQKLFVAIPAAAVVVFTCPPHILTIHFLPTFLLVFFHLLFQRVPYCASWTDSLSVSLSFAV